MNDNDTLLIRELSDSFRMQLDYYKALSGIVRKIMTRLVLSRGNFGVIGPDLAEKQRLLVCIEGERSRTAHQVQSWQERKKGFASTPDAIELDTVLQETERVIRDFLDGEDQLRKYIEGLLRKSAS